MAVDRTVLHLYSEDVLDAEDASESSSVGEVESDLRQLTSDVRGLQMTVAGLTLASGPLERLAEMWAAGQLRESTQHPQTQACVHYILDGTGSFAECGFSRTE